MSRREAKEELPTNPNDPSFHTRALRLFEAFEKLSWCRADLEGVRGKVKVSTREPQLTVDEAHD
jgi:hypothetical protein